jgi:hypothetical protein
VPALPALPALPHRPQVDAVVRQYRGRGALLWGKLGEK